MDVEFHKVTLVSASSARRTLTAQLRGAGSEGDDASAENFDAAEAVQPAGLAASPSITATTEAVVAFRGDEPVALFLIDKGAAAQTVESGETRLYGAGSANSTAVIRIRASGDIEVTPKAGRSVILAGGSLNVARSSDAVQVALTSALVGGIVAPSGGGPCTLASGTITLSGTITGTGATQVKA